MTFKNSACTDVEKKHHTLIKISAASIDTIFGIGPAYIVGHVKLFTGPRVFSNEDCPRDSPLCRRNMDFLVQITRASSPHCPYTSPEASRDIITTFCSKSPSVLTSGYFLVILANDFCKEGSCLARSAIVAA